MEFTYFLVDIDVWFKASTDKDGNQYYTYILVYVYGILIVERDPCKFIYMLMNK